MQLVFLKENLISSLEYTMYSDRHVKSLEEGKFENKPCLASFLGVMKQLNVTASICGNITISAVAITPSPKTSFIPQHGY